jgi:hypothetical protein
MSKISCGPMLGFGSSEGYNILQVATATNSGPYFLLRRFQSTQVSFFPDSPDEPVDPASLYALVHADVRFM